MVEKKVYTEEFQRMVTKAYYASNKSLVKIGKEFNVNPATVFHWSKRYRSDYQESVAVRQEISTFQSVINTEPEMKKKKEKLSPEQMEQRIIELEAQLKQEQMRSITLDKMIDVAEQELQIPIRKKSGAKQSR